jgi:hypothetical protein
MPRSLPWTVTVALLVWSCRAPDRIRLMVENVGQTPLDSVIVLTTGRSYPIGNIPAGTTRELPIGANGESHIELEHGRASRLRASRRRLIVGIYFESGYRGSIRVRVTADSVLAVLDSIRI